MGGSQRRRGKQKAISEGGTHQEGGEAELSALLLSLSLHYGYALCTREAAEPPLLSSPLSCVGLFVVRVLFLFGRTTLRCNFSDMRCNQISDVQMFPLLQIE